MAFEWVQDKEQRVELARLSIRAETTRKQFKEMCAQSYSDGLRGYFRARANGLEITRSVQASFDRHYQAFEKFAQALHEARKPIQLNAADVLAG